MHHNAQQCSHMSLKIRFSSLVDKFDDCVVSIGIVLLCSNNENVDFGANNSYSTSVDVFDKFSND